MNQLNSQPRTKSLSPNGNNLQLSGPTIQLSNTEMVQPVKSPVCTNKYQKHAHDDGHHSPIDSNAAAMKKLIIASLLCFVFMIVEVIGGLYANSLAVMTDAAHLLSDLAGIMISIFAMWLASIELNKQNSERHSFGFHRAEILGSLLSVLIIWLMTVGIVYEAVDRLRHPSHVDGKLMFITASFGLVVNIAMGFTLGHSHEIGGGHGHEHHDETVRMENGELSNETNKSGNGTENVYNDEKYDQVDQETYRGEYNFRSDSHGGGEGGTQTPHDETMGLNENQKINASTYGSNEENDHLVEDTHDTHDTHDNHNHEHHGGNILVRAAFIHVLGDAIQSVGVMFAAALIWHNPEWRIADPICTFVFGALVLFTTVRLMRNCIRILMEGVPEGISLSAIEQVLRNINGVQEVHDLHVWSLTAGKPSLSVHVLLMQDDDNKSREGKQNDTARHVLEEAHKLCAARFNIHHTTIQVERQSCLTTSK